MLAHRVRLIGFQIRRPGFGLPGPSWRSLLVLLFDRGNAVTPPCSSHSECRCAKHQQDRKHPSAGRVIVIREIDPADANGNTDGNEADNLDPLHRNDILKKFVL